MYYYCVGCGGIYCYSGDRFVGGVLGRVGGGCGGNIIVINGKC